MKKWIKAFPIICLIGLVFSLGFYLGPMAEDKINVLFIGWLMGWFPMLVGEIGHISDLFAIPEDSKEATIEKMDKIYQKLPEDQQKEVDRFVRKLIADQELDDARKLEGG